MTLSQRRLAAHAVVPLALSLAACGGGGGTTPPGPSDAGALDGGGVDSSYQPGQPLVLDVSAVFPAGTALREGYGGSALTVARDGTVSLTPDPSGVVLLEKDGTTAAPFSWANATVYYAMTDRFANGDPGNDGSYGRTRDGQMEVGTWHGGDWKGLTGKLDYLSQLGVTALWISPIVENVHGWVAGGSGDFKHWGYAGYWALDFTRLDLNWGTKDDLVALIDGAHQRGIRVLVDVVINHPGYATGADLAQYLPEVFFGGKADAFRAYDQSAKGSFNEWNNLVDYNSEGWTRWWGPTWIRAGFPGFDKGGSDDLTKQLAFLPDFKTESAVAAVAPVFLGRKLDSGFVAHGGFTPRQYLVKWHTDWVRQLGIDGFRCDTAKNVELESWKALKAAALSALADWKTANPGKKLDDAPFWMTGEVFGHGVMKDAYYTDGGFDSLINFAFQNSLTAALQEAAQLPAIADKLETLYGLQADAVSSDPTFDILSYISSHDTRLQFDALGSQPIKQRQSGTALLLAPGGVQIFYGDESGRKGGPSLSEITQATRSDMNWNSMDSTILTHFQKLGLFRKRHPAVGGGAHQRLTSPAGTYAFSRRGGGDAVVIAITPER